MKQNFFDHLDGGWGDLIADTYRDTINKTILKTNDYIFNIKDKNYNLLKDNFYNVDSHADNILLGSVELDNTNITIENKNKEKLLFDKFYLIIKFTNIEYDYKIDDDKPDDIPNIMITLKTILNNKVTNFYIISAFDEVEDGLDIKFLDYYLIDNLIDKMIINNNLERTDILDMLITNLLILIENINNNYEN